MRGVKDSEGCPRPSWFNSRLNLKLYFDVHPSEV